MFFIIIVSLILNLFLISFILIFNRKNIILLDKIYKYEEIINKQGMNNHEYNNQLMVLSGYLECQDYDNVREYLNTIIEDHRTGEDYDIKQLVKFPKGGFKELLYYKIAKIERNGIEYYLNVSDSFKKKIEKINIKNYSDLTKVFGVLIDNSIDASIDNHGEIEMNFKCQKNCLIIVVKNKIEELDLNEIGKKRFSTKGLYHGFGLQIVKKIVKNNEAIDVSYDKEDNQIIQTIVMDIK
ncbi:MAG: GHKL domain-containing protein [Bacilli bacterium]|nr:GHKL domain-containing protein [Bacilli bacterium]